MKGKSWRRKKLLAAAIFIVLVLLAIALSRNADSRKHGPDKGGQLLANGGFESGADKRPPESWKLRNDEAVEYRIEIKEDGGKVFHVRLIAESDYDKSFLLSQAIDIEGLRGKTIQYGGDVRTLNARVYLRLWAPEGNGQIEIEATSGYKHAAGKFKVPENASYLIFGAEIVGSKGGEAWLDNLYAQTAPPRPASKSGNEKEAVVTVDPSRDMGKISPLKFGGHVEWINSGHGVWDPKKKEVSRRVVNLLNQLHVPVWRFPGGVYSDYYNWKDGIGKADSRPVAIDPFDGKTKHRHDFGVDELIQFLGRTGSEALITANYGTGDMESAVSWLRYFKNKGVKVRLWEIGNEVYMADPRRESEANGARIFHTAKQYAGDFRKWSAALKSVDNDIMVGAIGGLNNTHPSNRDWMDTLLKEAGEKIDFIALHNAFAPVITGSFDYTSEENRLNAYRTMLAQVEDFKADVAAVKKKMKQYAPDRAEKIGIAVTEHFPIFGDFNTDNEDQLRQNIDQTRTMAGALYTASLLTAIINDPQIFMANYLNPVHQYFGAFLNLSSEGLIKNPVYHVYDMFRNHFGDRLVFSKVEGPYFSTPRLGMTPAIPKAPVIEAVAANDKDGRTAVAIVNRDFENSVTVKVNIKGVKTKFPARLYFLSAQPDAVAAPPLSRSTRRQDIRIGREDIEFASGRALTLPACSLTILKMGRSPS